MGSVAQGNVSELKIKSIIGFDGSTINGFIIHPDKEHVVYALGDKVSILHWATKKQEFLSGHTNIISAIDVSITGKYIASGQINHIGFKAGVILWDFENRSILSKYDTHKVRVEAVAFSTDERYLLSLGGRDCGSVVVWDVKACQALCGSPAASGVQGEASVLCPTNRRGACFLTAGEQNLMVWRIDRNARNVKGVNVNMSKLKRNILSMDLNERDEVCYCGTTTGDVLKIRLNFHHDAEILEPIKPPIVIGCFAKARKSLNKCVELYGQGVRSIKLMENGNLLIGAGDGIVELVEEMQKSEMTCKRKLPIIEPSQPGLRTLKCAFVKSSVTSLQIWRGKTILAGTINCEIFSIDIKTFVAELIVTCHTSTIFDLAFPRKFSDVFATASKDDVRVWAMSTMQELLRIKVQNFCCSSVVFTHDGTAILTAWNDGVIRAFTPLTGRLIYAIFNAHNKGASALDITPNGRTIVSGGCEGQVRLWNVTAHHQKLICTLKEHRAPISAIQVNNSGDEAVSAGTDGSCIIWDIVRQHSKNILFANTLFMTVCYYPTPVQILTGGSDRKVGYWEVLDGTLVREVEASTSGAINSLDISPDGELFVTGGNDQIVKLWKYQQGVTTHIGLGHSAVISSTKFSPDEKHIVSASASGSIFIWENPFYKEKPVEKEPAAPQPEQKQKVEIKIEEIKKHSEEHVEEAPTARSEAAPHKDTCPCQVMVRRCCTCPQPEKCCTCP